VLSATKQRGMTLLEVLVALVIFAIGCMAIIRTTGMQVRSLTLLEEKTMASWVADNQLVVLYLSHVRPATSWQQGISKMAERDWYWRYRSMATMDEGIYAVVIEVSDNEGFKPIIVTLKSWVK